MTRPLRERLNELSPTIIQTVQLVFRENQFATSAIADALALHPDWEEDRRSIFSETVYDLIRWWRPLWYIINQEPTSEETDLQKLLAIYLFTKKGDLTVLQKKRGLNTNDILKRLKTIKTTRALRVSLPDWLDDQGEKELGAQWDVVSTSLNESPTQFLRVNTLKTTKAQLVRLLRKDGIIAEPLDWNPDALIIREKTNPFRLTSFHAGLFEVQDAASQMVSRLLNPEPGMRLIDACAGEGSKTLHCGTLMNNKGKIIALDNQEWRLKELRKRATKAGIDTIETHHVTSSKDYKRMNGTADRLLLDVPCSGLGTLRRNPDIRWKLTPESLTRLNALQLELLDQYCVLLKPTGILAYSVCSIFPSEGEHQIERFLTTHAQFSRLREQRYWPQTNRTDGFYIALLQRSE